MRQRCTIPVMALMTAWMFSAVTHAQPPASSKAEAAKKAAPAPRRDLSGIWRPAVALDGIQPNGARSMPADGLPEHELAYTPFGLEMFKRNRPSNGPTEVASAEENDPAHSCEPQGFPRESLFEMRATQFIQTPQQMIMLYTYGKLWRVIWTDGRELPKDPDTRWFGYSVGKWKDEYTFVVETNGMDERTWLDNAGRPHSEDLRVEERFHRVDHDTMEISMTIDDPKVYRKAWVAQDKIPFKLQPANTELPELLCSPSELAEYNRRHASRGAGTSPAGAKK